MSAITPKADVWLLPTVPVPGFQGSICGQVVCGDGHVVGGWDFLPATQPVESVALTASAPAVAITLRPTSVL